MNFGIAKMFGATDKRFQDRYNYLIEIISKYASGILSSVYPIGSIYISVSPTSPSELFGGTWVATGVGRVLVGIDATQTEFDTVGETGGAKTHALTSAENGTHTHLGTLYENATHTGGHISAQGASAAANYGDVANMIQASGNGSPHNNLQPYEVVYMWKRTA